jgi:ubiquinone/menaquinone biosynthesis C-methylase UbiE
VAARCGIDATHRILDLGCGPGQLALAFAPLAGEVLGIDPEPEMLRIARA